MLDCNQLSSDCIWLELYMKKNFYLIWASLVAQTVKRLPAVWETWVQSLGWEHPLEKGNGNPLQDSCLENSMD